MIRFWTNAEKPELPDYLSECLALGAFYNELDKESLDYICEQAYLDAYTRKALELEEILEASYEEDLISYIPQPFTRFKSVDVYCDKWREKGLYDLFDGLRNAGLRFHSSFPEMLEDRFSLISEQQMKEKLKRDLIELRDKMAIRDDLDDVKELEEFFAANKQRYIKVRADLSSKMYKILKKVG